MDDRNLVGEFLREKIAGYEFRPRVASYGKVVSFSDGVTFVEGLRDVGCDEIIDFGENRYGLAFELSEEGVGVVMLTPGSLIPGTLALGTGHIADIGVGDAMIGRVIDPLGRPLDGKPLRLTKCRHDESPAPKIIDRSPVNRAFPTGILAIDSMIPIGKGQRELIVGDRRTGKTSIALSAIKNQKGRGVICVYCTIGQRAAETVRIVEELRESDALDYTFVVAATASDPAALQYLAPFAATGAAEYFMYSGNDVMIVYDDLSKHAAAYRTISLLLKRPSGREAYPGDIFYLHSRLLERSAQLSRNNGGGSLTAFPIIETQAEDVSAYIPTNVISITDGQIYVSTSLFLGGQRPAINVGLSVSRTGGAAQQKQLKKLSASLRIELSRMREQEKFARYGGSTGGDMAEGKLLNSLLIQPKDTIYSAAEEAAILAAYRCGAFSSVPLNRIGEAITKMLADLHENDRALLENIEASGNITDTNLDALIGAVKRHLASYC